MYLLDEFEITIIGLNMDTEKYLDDLEDYLKVGREKSKGNIKLDIKKEFPNIKKI